MSRRSREPRPARNFMASIDRSSAATISTFPDLSIGCQFGLLEYRYELWSRVVEPFGTEPPVFTDLSGDGEHVICRINRAINVSGGEPSIERKHHHRSAN